MKDASRETMPYLQINFKQKITLQSISGHFSKPGSQVPN